jgi:tRNA pseudouridine13 synthase
MPAVQFALNAFQAAWFNTWLVERIERGSFSRLEEGDLVGRLTSAAISRKVGPGDDRKFETGEITYTGPMFGAWMQGTDEATVAGRCEADLFGRTGVTSETLSAAQLAGSRRAGCIRITEATALAITEAEQPDAIKLSFSLPRGSYATSLLREFIKSDDLELGCAESDGSVSS